MHLADITMFYARESGGVRRYLNAKRRWFANKSGHRHSLLTPGRHRAQGEPGQYLLPSLPLPMSNGYRFPLTKRPWINKLVSLQPDLIESGDPYVTAWAALEAGQQLGSPTLAFYHSDLPRALGNRLGKSGTRIGNHYIRALYREFDLVLAPSLTMVQRLEELGIGPVKLQPLGVDTDAFRPQNNNKRSLKHQLNIPFKSHLLIFAGRYSREKNIPLLFETMRRLGRDYHLLLVGPGMPESGLINVHTLDHYIDQAALAPLLAGCDALIHAGAEETFGLIVLEAMACGLPVVGAAVGGVSELVDASTGILAEPGNVNAYTEAVTALFAGDHQAMGLAARHLVTQRWSWDSSFQTLLRTYENITGQITLPQPGIFHATS